MASLAGFEQPQYNVNEGDGVVEICAAIMEPSDLLLLPNSYLANFSLSLANGTAVGKFTNLCIRLSLSLTMSSNVLLVYIFIGFSLTMSSTVLLLFVQLMQTLTISLYSSLSHRLCQDNV